MFGVLAFPIVFILILYLTTQEEKKESGLFEIYIARCRDYILLTDISYRLIETYESRFKQKIFVRKSSNNRFYIFRDYIIVHSLKGKFWESTRPFYLICINDKNVKFPPGITHRYRSKTIRINKVLKGRLNITGERLNFEKTTTFSLQIDFLDIGQKAILENFFKVIEIT